MIINLNKITLPELENYDIEIGIPSGQILFNTIQGNWGISTDENNNGTTYGIYRDGYTSDGSIFKEKAVNDIKVIRTGSLCIKI